MSNVQAALQKVVKLNGVRLSFPNLIEPRKPKEGFNGEPAYGADLIVPPDHPGFQQFWKLVNELAVEKWKEHGPAIIQSFATLSNKRCYGQGNEKVKQATMQPYDGYAGNAYIAVKRKERDGRPQIILADGSLLDAADTWAYKEETRKLYGGCYVNVAIRPWLQDNKDSQIGKGVRCDLIAIQFAKDGTPFGEGAVDASSMFGAAEQAPAAALGGLPAFMQQPAAAMPAAPFPGNPVIPSFLQ